MELNKKTVLFCDLDDTLIKTCSGKTFGEDPTDFRIRKDVIDKIRVAMPELHMICIVTNQGGIPTYISEGDFNAKLEAVKAFLVHSLNENPNDLLIDVFSYYCASTDESDPLRKPNPGMLERFMSERLYYAAPTLKDKANMLMIGDASGKEGDYSDSDKVCAEAFGIDYCDVEDFVNL